jgi:hypothetical protein
MAVMPRSPRRTLIAAFTLAACAVAGAADAQTRVLPDAPGVWKPWKPFQAAASTRKDQAATPAEVKAFEAELVRLNDIARRAPGVGSPKGFSVETWGNLDGYRVSSPGQPAGATMPIAGTFTFGAFPIFEYTRNGQVLREDTGETALLGLHINQLQSALFGGKGIPEWGAINTDAFLQPAAAGEIAGFRHVGDAIVITNNAAPLWTPISLADALALVVANRQTVVDGFQESLDKFKAQLTNLRDPVRQAKRKKEAADASASMPNPSAFLAQMEEAWRIEEATVVKELSATGGTGKGLIDAQHALDEVTSRIAELAPADRVAPACYAANAAGVRAAFRTESGGCVAIVRPNYQFFNRTLPRTAPQIIVITSIARCFDTSSRSNTDATSSSPAGCSANRKLIETIDKDALRGWLR